jgi:AraC-like DNA-binding protein
MRIDHFHASHPDPSDKPSFYAWQEEVMRPIVNCTYSPFEDRTVFVRGWMGSLGRVQFGRVQSSGGSSDRDQRQTDDTDDRLNLVVPIQDCVISITQNGWERTLATNSLGLVRLDEPAVIGLDRRHDSWLVFLSKREIIERCPRFADRDAHVALNAGAAGRLIRAYLDHAGSIASDIDDAMGDLMAAHLTDLIVLALRNSHDNRDAAEAGGLKVLRRKAILSFIADHFRQPRLGLGDCVAKTGLSRSYIQELLEAVGTSFSLELRRTRIAAASFMLARPECRSLSITDIAFNSGFSDLSTFNRAFRAVVQETPSAFRARRAP